MEYKGAIYHVMARGNRREDIYLDDEDRRFFLGTLAEACGMTGWRVHGWVLMSNHYHLCIETPEANLVAGMKWLQNTVTRRFNVRHRKWGRLFGDRYKAIPVEGGNGYGRALMDYIHLNPVRAGIISAERKESVMDYPWSSVAGGYVLPPEKRAKWFYAEGLLAEFGLPDTVEGRRLYVEHLDRLAAGEAVKEAGLALPAAEVDKREMGVSVHKALIDREMGQEKRVSVLKAFKLEAEKWTDEKQQNHAFDSSQTSELTPRSTSGKESEGKGVSVHKALIDRG